jgi:hypothetical protein
MRVLDAKVTVVGVWPLAAYAAVMALADKNLAVFPCPLFIADTAIPHHFSVFHSGDTVFRPWAITASIHIAVGVAGAGIVTTSVICPVRLALAATSLTPFRIFNTLAAMRCCRPVAGIFTHNMTWTLVDSTILSGPVDLTNALPKRVIFTILNT